MRHAPLAVVILATATATAFALGGCRSRESPVERGIREQVFHIGNGVEPGDLDPHTNTGSPEGNILDTLFEPLIRRNRTADGFDPAAAESWEIAEGGRVYTFHLRAGMRWSNGDPVTAMDYRDSFKRALTPTLGSQPVTYMYPIAGAEDYHKGRLTDFSRVGIKAPDDLTLVITLSEPVVYFLEAMRSYPFVAVHLKSVEHYGGLDRSGTAWTRPGNLVTNGPFRLKAWRPNQVLIVERDPFYWDAANVRLREIHFHPIESQDTEERAFRSGLLHATNGLPESKIDTYRRENPGALRINPRLGANYVVFNVARAPFDDARVRRAFTLAIDRDALVTRVLRGGQPAAYSLSQPGMGGYQPTHIITGGPDEARRLLAQAGFPGGAGFPQVEYLYNTSDRNRDIAAVLQEMWRRELAVDVRVVNQEWKVFLNNRDLGNFQFARAGWNPFAAEPTDYFQQLLTDGTYNDSNWSDPGFDRLYRAASTTADIATRHALYQEMDAILLREMPLAPLFYSSEVYLIHPSVRNWTHSLLDYRPYHGLWLEPLQ